MQEQSQTASVFTWPPGDVRRRGAEKSRFEHKGPILPDALRRLLTCDGDVRAVTEINGVPFNVGRTQHIVPDRTRIIVEHRDQAFGLEFTDRRGRVLTSHGRPDPPPDRTTWPKGNWRHPLGENLYSKWVDFSPPCPN